MNFKGVKRLCFLLLYAAAAPCSSSADKVRVVASTLDMADMAAQIGGDKVDVYAVTRGQYDLHFFEPRPSQVLKLKKADLMIVGGLGVDSWVNGMIDAARNERIRFGKPGFVDPAKGAHAHDVPTSRITGDMGDVHPYGNPHYWFTPENVRAACSNITEGLVRVAPEHADHFKRGREAYVARVDEAFDRLRSKMEPFRGIKVLQYHASWDYFCETFGLEIVGSVEPKPGIPPSASHLAKLVQLIKGEDVKLLLVEPYFSEKPLRFLRANTDIKPLRLALYLGGNEGCTTYLQHIEHMVLSIEKALKE